MRIRLFGQRNTSGIGTHYACFADALRKIQGIGHLVEEVDGFDNSALMSALNSSQDNDINISFVALNLHDNFRGHNIQWVVFESTKIPENIMAVLLPSEQIWVPTAWGRSVLITHGIPADRIRVIPEAVDGNLFHTHGRKPYTKDRPFRFLTVGKYERRKSIDEILEAFAQVYANTPAIELIIKSNYFMNHDQKFQALQNKVTSLGLDNVQLLWGEMTRSDMAELYRSCDCFVLPSKAEGWGLPLIEAAASGLPVISTAYSGHTEFLQIIPDSVLSVTHTMGAIDCPEYKIYYPDSQSDWGMWARPDVYSIAACMQTVCREYSELFESACANSFTIRRTFTWQNSADLAIAAMGPIADFRAKSMTYNT
jgi:glycosyltransferase involved in cell wall biosynthesis